MRKARIVATSRGRICITTTNDGSPVPQALVGGKFRADAPNKLWVEAFSVSLECAPLDLHVVHRHAEARIAVFRNIEGWYNPHRENSELDHQLPVTAR